MSVHSELGRGSCFEFEWTAKVAPAAAGSGGGLAVPGGPTSTMTVHGFTADECSLLRRLRVLHLGELTPTARSWRRVADSYGVHVDYCSTVEEARALLQRLIRAGATPAAALGPAPTTPGVGPDATHAAPGLGPGPAPGGSGSALDRKSVV